MLGKQSKKLGISIFALAVLLLALPAQAGGWLGVAITEEVEYDEGGARITHVIDGSPAEAAGVQDGDIIVGVDGRTVRGPMSLTKQIRDKQPGDSVSLTIVRDGREQTIDVEIGERRQGSHGRSFSFDHRFDFEGLEGLGERMGDLGERLGEMFDCDDGDCVLNCDDGDCSLFNCDDDCNFSFQGWTGSCDGDDCSDFQFNWSGRRPLLGVQLSESTKELLEHLGSPDGIGVLVSKVIAGSPAEAAGVEVGDVIISIAGREVESVHDIRRGLAENQGRNFDLEVIRDRATRRLEVTLPETEDFNRPAMMKRAGEKT